MSLATLARKTRAKQRINTRGKFILNMTGRGHVLGMNAKMSRGNCKGLTKCAGKRAACCVGVGGESDCCRFPHGGKPAPQMGYGVYLNRKSKGAYHPGGGKQCKTLPGCERAKTVWKQGSNLDASVVITNKKDNVLACNSDVYTAKRDTCTGCKECDEPNNNLTVEIQNDPDAIGWLDPDFGAFVPTTINGNTVVALYWYNNGGDQWLLLAANGTVAETMFSSISFVNCEGKTRTYYQGAHAGTTAAAFPPLQQGLSIWTWDAAASGFSIADEQTYWQGAVNSTLQVYIDNPNPNPCACPQCCCPVKKNICGCRATDLVRYTRINKSFGCQTTKAIRQGRSASEQIARRRAAVDCIKPKHKTIYIKLAGNDDAAIFEFDGCCGNQCLIPGQQYTFHITNTITIIPTIPIFIFWCGVMPDDISALGPGQYDIFYVNPGVNSKSFTVPKFNTSSKCVSSRAIIAAGHTNTPFLPLDYCKQAYKRPQMLGSCSGR